MLAFFDALTTILVIVVPIALVIAFVLRDKANQSAERVRFYDKASFVLGWATTVVLFATAVVELIQGQYLFMVVHFILFGFFVHFMNRDAIRRQKTQ